MPGRYSANCMYITSNQEFVTQAEIRNMHVSFGQYIRVCSIILMQEYIYLWHTKEADKKDGAGHHHFGSR